jgi:hypothetical protein
MMATREAPSGSRERPLTYVSLGRTVASLLSSKALGKKARWVIRGSRLPDREVGQDRVKIPVTFIPFITPKSGSRPGSRRVRRIG